MNDFEALLTDPAYDARAELSYVESCAAWIDDGCRYEPEFTPTQPKNEPEID